MSAVPIDPKSRGALLSACDSLKDFREDVEIALPAIEHCDVAAVALKGHWLEQNLRQIQTCMDYLRENTTEAHENRFAGRKR